MTAARTLANKQRQAVRWEARRIAQALPAIEGPVLLLKGAAYAIADLPPAAGRLFGDIDILVPHPQLGQVEAALMLAGWHTQKQDDYDQRYYRRWMHELPPMTHIRRGTVLDVHHNLLPETARIRTQAAPILAAAHALAGPSGLSIPARSDPRRICSPHAMLHGLYVDAGMFHVEHVEVKTRESKDLNH